VLNESCVYVLCFKLDWKYLKQWTFVHIQSDVVVFALRIYRGEGTFPTNWILSIVSQD